MSNSDNILDSGIHANPLVKLPIYSRNSIWVFSFFFSTIFGGVLLMQNLKDIGKPREANLVLVISIGYAVTALVLFMVWEEMPRAASYAVNILGAIILTELLYKKHIPNADMYEKKSIRKPLLIALGITVVFILLLVAHVGV
jgi:hypothetical protein